MCKHNMCNAVFENMVQIIKKYIMQTVKYCCNKCFCSNINALYMLNIYTYPAPYLSCAMTYTFSPSLFYAEPQVSQGLPCIQKHYIINF